MANREKSEAENFPLAEQHKEQNLEPTRRKKSSVTWTALATKRRRNEKNSHRTAKQSHATQTTKATADRGIVPPKSKRRALFCPLVTFCESQQQQQQKNTNPDGSPSGHLHSSFPAVFTVPMLASLSCPPAPLPNFLYVYGVCKYVTL